MAKYNYLRPTQSVMLERAEEIGFALIRDLEWLKEAGLQQQHIDKLFELLALVKDTGTHREFAKTKLDSTDSRNKIRKEIIFTVNLLESWMDLNCETNVKTKRIVYIREVRNAKIIDFKTKTDQLIEQLKNLSSETVNNSEIEEYWIPTLSNLINEFSTCKVNCIENITQSTDNTSERKKNFGIMMAYLSKLAKLAKIYWKHKKSPRYNDYKLCNKFRVEDSE